MGIVLTVILAVFVFGFLIFIHEFGHYIFARIFHVSIKEFSIGMGPKLLTRVSKKTGIRYSIAAFPIGGFVSMEGEDGANEKSADDPNSFDKKPAWQRLIITAAGATINIVFGFLVMLVMSFIVQIGGTQVAEFYREYGTIDIEADPSLAEDEEFMKYIEEVRTMYDTSSEDSGLRAGDVIVRVGGKRVYNRDDMNYEIMRRGDRPIDVTVVRDGEKVTVEDVAFPVMKSQGQSFGAVDFAVYAIDVDSFDGRVFPYIGFILRYAVQRSVLIVRMCWESLYDLITGRYTIAAVSGPVGISEVIGEAAGIGIDALLYIVALISINLGVMNLLPLPALDGGRVILALVEITTKKRLPPKVENIMNTVFLGLLLAFSAFIMVKDVVMLFIG